MRHPHCTLIVIAALLAASTLTSAQEPPAGGPKLVIPERIKDFGAVAQGEILNANFKLVNEGSQVLTIKSVRPTCGCTVAEFDKEVAPGKEGWVKAKLDTTAFSGPIVKSVLVISDDPGNPTANLIIKADVQPYLLVLPRPLVRFNAIQGETASQELTIVTDQPGSFSVTGVESSVPYVTAAVRKLADQELVADKQKDQYKIAINLGPDAPVGPLSATLTVSTDHPKAKKLQLKVYGVVRALIHVTPPDLQFGSVEAKLKPARNVIVVNNQPDKAVEVTAAVVNDAAFETAIVTIEKDRRYQVTVTIKAEADAGSRDAVLTISTSDPAHPQLSVPVRANIQ
jgi:hypothetical protein